MNSIRYVLRSASVVVAIGITSSYAAAWSQPVCNNPNNGTDDDIASFPGAPANGTCATAGAACWDGDTWEEGLTYAQGLARTCASSSGSISKRVRAYALQPLEDAMADFPGANEYSAYVYYLTASGELLGVIDTTANGSWSSWQTVSASASQIRVAAYVHGS